MFGGKSTEYEVSLMSVTSVLQQIDRGRYDVMMLGVTKDGRWLYYDGDMVHRQSAYISRHVFSRLR